MPHATQYFIRNTILILGKALICSQNSLVALISHDAFENRLLVDMLASHYFAHLSAVQSCDESPILPHPQGVPLDSDLLSEGGGTEVH